MSKLLVLGAGLLQIPVIEKAHEIGCFVIAADGNPSAPGLKIADKGIVANITSEEEMLNIAKSENIDGVIHPCSEVAMGVMGRINDEMCLSGISKEIALKSTNKHLMRLAFERYGAPSPKSYETFNSDEAWGIFSEKFPVSAILKPSRNSGSRGIATVLKNINRIEFNDLYDRALKESRDKSVLIEEYVDGPEFSVEIIIWDNKVNVLALTDKKTTGAPYFVELGHNQPSIYPEPIQNAVIDAAIAGVKALKLNNCAAHAEVKIDSNSGKAYIIEIGARLGGDFISTDLTYISSGVDMVKAAIMIALGQEPNFEPTKPMKGVCIRYICPSPGKVTSIEGVESLKNDCVYDFSIYCRIGDKINEIKSSLDRSGHVIVVGNTVEQAIESAANIISEVSIKTL